MLESLDEECYRLQDFLDFESAMEAHWGTDSRS